MLDKMRSFILIFMLAIEYATTIKGKENYLSNGVKMLR